MSDNKEYPENKMDTGEGSGANMKEVYAGPEMLGVYAGPEYFEERSVQEDNVRGFRARPPMRLVYAGPEFFGKKPKKVPGTGGVRFCTECGRKLENDFKFCPECGTRIADTDNE